MPCILIVGELMWEIPKFHIQQPYLQQGGSYSLLQMIHHLPCHITTYDLLVTNIITLTQSPSWCSSGCFPIHSASTPQPQSPQKKFCKKHVLISPPYHLGFTTQKTLSACKFIVQFGSLLAISRGLLKNPLLPQLVNKLPAFMEMEIKVQLHIYKKKNANLPPW
jgi:hypothetical protein